LARFYPGLPDNYESWSEIKKLEWVASIPSIIAYYKRLDAAIHYDDPEAAFNAEMLLTGNRDLANKIRNQMLASEREAKRKINV